MGRGGACATSAPSVPPAFYINCMFVSFMYVQGISFRNGLYELALRDKDMQVRLGLKMVLEPSDGEFLGTITIFQKSDISWPQQPRIKKGAKISKKLDF